MLPNNGSRVGLLDGRIAIVTGAGRGLGRAHAVHLASQGARVVVNDLGRTVDAGGADDVVAEITEAGGTAVANHDDVVDWDGGQRLVNAALEEFGGLDILVNNAGFLADRSVVNMSEAEWDEVTGVHLKGHFVPTRWAASYWRDQAKAGTPRQAAIINTTSTSGLLGNPGQSNYGAAKAGVAAFSQICAQELQRYQVRSNCIAPAARTRLTENAPGLAELVAKPGSDTGFDVWDPANVSPLVAWLASADCPANGRTFFIQGGTVRLMEGWRFTDSVEQESRWSPESLGDALAPLVDPRS